MNQTEWLFWERLRRRSVDGWKFRRQHPIGEFYVDFYCPAARLVVELNGPAHDDAGRRAHDQRRQAWLESQGYRVLNLNLSELDGDIEAAMEAIYGELVEQEKQGFHRTKQSSPRPSPRSGEVPGEAGRRGRAPTTPRPTQRHGPRP